MSNPSDIDWQARAIQAEHAARELEEELRFWQQGKSRPERGDAPVAWLEKLSRMLAIIEAHVYSVGKNDRTIAAIREMADEIYRARSTPPPAQGEAEPNGWDFDTAWRSTGYQYGQDALENVRAGWDLCMAYGRRPPRFICGVNYGMTAMLDPQDCNWPVCGCDPYADKVIDSLQESGHMPSPAKGELLERIAELERQLAGAQAAERAATELLWKKT